MAYRGTPWFIGTKRRRARMATIRGELAAALWELRRVERDKFEYLYEANELAAKLERLRQKHEALQAERDSGGPGGFLIRAYDAVVADPPFNAPDADATP